MQPAIDHRRKVSMLKQCTGQSTIWESENLVLNPAPAPVLLTARMGLSVLIWKVGDGRADPRLRAEDCADNTCVCPPSAWCKLDARQISGESVYWVSVCAM